MAKYFLNNEEYTLDEITSAAEKRGLDIDAYIEEYNIEVKDEEEKPLEVDVIQEPEGKQSANFKDVTPINETAAQEVIEEKPEEIVEEKPDETKIVKTEEDLQKENAEIDELLTDLIPEVPDEEKRNLPYSVQQRIIKQYGGKFTRGNVDVELERFEQLKADPFKNIREGFEGDKKAFNEKHIDTRFSSK